MKPRFVLASRNAGKLLELSEMLKGIEIAPLPEGAPEPLEDGDAFEENALIKARSAMEFTGLPAIADDSGLCVDALSGAPGVYSARYGSDEYLKYAGLRGLDADFEALPPGAGDMERVLLLLKNMSGVPDDKRGARFVCAAACVWADGEGFTVRGECEGMITRDVRGTGGFGYDPVFYVPEYGCTFGELESVAKNRISHRAKAMLVLKRRLEGNFDL